ncbi:MAG: sigma-70 family RNA polymerase sigma factor [candidate division WS1 bacterium]|jgi:RNA polymerase sigma-70 factor (ECF subfamily)|nr:sigma-70 family RNA polymerase sigma factor [candidate division WS1 bacterium]
MTAGPTLSLEQIQGLVRRAQQGDNAAFEQLVELYKTKIYNYALRMLGDPDTAEDVAQETFIKAYSSLSSFRGAAAFQTWLYRIASNLAIDTVRRRKYRQNTFSLDEPIETSDGPIERDIEDDAAGPERRFESAQLQQQVSQAIVQLSPKLRTVLVLYELQGLSYDEIAGIVGAPLGTVKSRLFNAREQLKKILVDEVDVETFR